MSFKKSVSVLLAFATAACGHPQNMKSSISSPAVLVATDKGSREILQQKYWTGYQSYITEMFYYEHDTYVPPESFNPESGNNTTNPFPVASGIIISSKALDVTSSTIALTSNRILPRDRILVNNEEKRTDLEDDGIINKYSTFCSNGNTQSSGIWNALAYVLPTATCSAVMISPKHILTAGHCVKNSARPEFDSSKAVGPVSSSTSEETLLFVPASSVQPWQMSGMKRNDKYGAKNVYRVKSIKLHQALKNNDNFDPNKDKDFAVLELAQAVDSTIGQPLKIYQGDRLPKKGEPLIISHFPWGSNQNMAFGHFWRRFQSDGGKVSPTFTHALNSMAGSSGAPILQARSRQLFGMHIRGENSFTFDRVRNCWKPVICDFQKDGLVDIEDRSVPVACRNGGTAQEIQRILTKDEIRQFNYAGGSGEFLQTPTEKQAAADYAAGKPVPPVFAGSLNSLKNDYLIAFKHRGNADERPGQIDDEGRRVLFGNQLNRYFPTLEQLRDAAAENLAQAKSEGAFAN